jgi:hypothetical protein
LTLWLGIGGLLALVALVAPLRWAAGVTAFCIPFAGTAVLMLGKDGIGLPLVVMGGFLARFGLMLFTKRHRESAFAILPNDLATISFVVYCAVSGLLFPRVFAGETRIFSQESVVATFPLGPDMISVVQITYLVIAFLGYWAMRHAALQVGLGWMVIAMALQALFLGGLGFAQAIGGLAGVPVSMQWIANNEGYALLIDATHNGFARISSAFPEASSFSAYAIAPMAFFYALYVSGVRPILSFLVLGLVTVTLLLSTSSTAYGAMAIFGFYAVLHAALDPDRKRRDRGLLVIVAGLVVVAVALVFVMTAEGGFLLSLRETIEEMTFGKAQSGSGQERMFWAMTSVGNAFDTGLIGVGYGAARSSGLLFGLFGTVGLIGLSLFFLMLFQHLAPAFRRVTSRDDAIAAAASFAIFPTIGALALSGTELGMTQIFWPLAAMAAAPLKLRERMMEAESASAVASLAAAIAPTGARRPGRAGVPQPNHLAR